MWATKNRIGEGQNCREIDYYLKRRLGNFVLLELRLNIQGTNDDVWVKADRYLDGFEQEPSTDLQHVKNVGKYIRKVVKARQDIKRQSIIILNFIMKLSMNKKSFTLSLQ